MQNLHLGCLDRKVDGWLNTDITPHIYVARVPGAASVMRRLGLMSHARHEQHREGVFRDVRYLDVTKRFPFATGSVHNVFSAHMLEHLHVAGAEHCLREIHRVLKPGGICRLVVPDLDAIVRSYDAEHPEILLEAIFEASQRSEKNRHHWMYNACSLGALLRAVGFGDVRRCAYREGRCPDLEFLDCRPDGSLFMEATR